MRTFTEAEKRRIELWRDCLELCNRFPERYYITRRDLLRCHEFILWERAPKGGIRLPDRLILSSGSWTPPRAAADTKVE